MAKVSINGPKTPVTEGSGGIASATMPNVCKMPGPPAPFVPTPLPNIGKSGMSPKDYSKDVTIEGKKVAIKGATFKSMGDIASKGTGGGLVSANCEGLTVFVGPGSMDVKIEGKNVQLLGDPMLNNCGPSGSPANAATMQGILQLSGLVTFVKAGTCPVCGKEHEALRETRKTKESTGILSGEFSKRAETGTRTMLGVVKCQVCKKVQSAANSGKTRRALTDAAEVLGMLHEDLDEHDQVYLKKGRKVAKQLALQPFKDALGDNFQAVFDEAEEVLKRSDGNPEKGAAFPPGNCAAQKGIVILLADGGIPGAMTEEWFSNHLVGPDGEPSPTGTPSFTVTKMYFYSRQKKRGFKLEAFGHGKTVPPCNTCSYVLPYLICVKDKVECHHKAKKKKPSVG